MVHASILGTKMDTYLKSCHNAVPGIRHLPFPVLAIICLVALANAITWAAIGIVLVCSC